MGRNKNMTSELRKITAAPIKAGMSSWAAAAQHGVSRSDVHGVIKCYR